jgi:thiol:disulfide interchange protein DsbA
MRLIQNLFFALALLGAAGAHASADKPISGREYLMLPETQNTDAGAKIEVTEFFSYACPHCHAFEPELSAWIAKNQGKIVFKRVHLAFSAGEVPLQRLYSTLEAMGIAEANHGKVFEAIHVKRARMNSDEAVFEWAQNAGLDRAKFTEAYRSFGTQARVNRAKTLATAYMVRQWPMIAIDGRFMTSPHQVGSAVNPPLGEAESRLGAFKVMDMLVARALAEKK